jgi:uncharacterized membrane protein YgcG
MRELFDIIRANPWPFGAGLFVVILMIIVENFGHGITGDGAAGGDFSDAGGCDGGGGDGGGGD